jgi:hypothetical protein
MINEEEAWFHHVVKDFDYIVCSGKYGPLFYKLLSDEAKTIINNMYHLEKLKLEVECLSQ